MPLSGGPQGLNRDSSEEDEEAQCYESEIQFTDNPILKDFLNLSNGGGRFIKATQDAKRNASGAAAGVVGLSSQSKIYQHQNGAIYQPQNQTSNNFYVNNGKMPA